MARTQGSRMEGVDEGAMTAPQFETSFNLEWNVSTFDLSFRSFFNGPTPAYFIVCFRYFQTNIITNFTTN